VERLKDGTYGTVELERKYVGQMYGGDCYVIQYSYTARGRENHIVYFWLVFIYSLFIYLFISGLFCTLQYVRCFWMKTTLSTFGLFSTANSRGCSSKSDGDFCG